MRLSAFFPLNQSQQVVTPENLYLLFFWQVAPDHTHIPTYAVAFYFPVRMCSHYLNLHTLFMLIAAVKLLTSHHVIYSFKKTAINSVEF